MQQTTLIRGFIEHFAAIHLLVVSGLFLLGLYWMNRRQSVSRFKVREADRLKQKPHTQKPPHAPKKPPLRLEGFSEQKTPHQILGVKPDATKKQIQKAYRELMKRYHPDRFSHLSPKDQERMKDIAAKINEAKDALIG